MSPIADVRCQTPDCPDETCSYSTCAYSPRTRRTITRSRSAIREALDAGAELRVAADEVARARLLGRQRMLDGVGDQLSGGAPRVPRFTASLRNASIRAP